MYWRFIGTGNVRSCKFIGITVFGIIEKLDLKLGKF